MGKSVMVVLLTLALVGCRPQAGETLYDLDQNGVLELVCIGDSNTSPAEGSDTWCQLANEILPPEVRLVNETPWAIGSATMRATSFWWDYAEQATDLLASAQTADGVITSLGTNDTVPAFGGPSSASLVASTANDVHDTILDPGGTDGIQVLVTSVPLMCPALAVDPGAAVAANDLIAAYNAALGSDWDLLDFTEDFVCPDDYIDGVHFNEAAQQERAQRAVDRIFSGTVCITTPEGQRTVLPTGVTEETC